ncbi:methyltransferase-like protein 7A [Lytechinus variegatus]|uniref:methyltransferase-like protein 7A n=1 Tax=Lytechinus variegatus TaxID=7654 RepID=UPI001BB1AE44|nr:methyltransferase-like protein 7A [Lytechinus variegatus]
MALIDAKMSGYFQQYVVPLAGLFIVLRILHSIYLKLHPIVFAMICPIVSKRHHGDIKEQKEKLFSELLNSRPYRDDSNQRFLALEIGCGTGQNFAFYPPNTSLAVVEPNSRFETSVTKNAAKYPSLEITKFLSMGAEDLRGHVEDSSLDAVVSTLTMCSVKDIEAVLSEVYRILKPGGRFFFIEHTETHTKNSWTHLFQRILAPFFYSLAGCHINNTFCGTLDRAGFGKVQYTKMDIRKCPRLFRSHVFGCATK